MTNLRNKILYYLAIVMVGMLFVLDITVMKSLHFFGNTVNGGVLLLPIFYVIGNLIVEFYGNKLAKKVILIGFFIDILSMVLFDVVISPFISYKSILLNGSIRNMNIFIIFIITTILTSFFNIFIFKKLKNSSSSHSLYFIKNSFISCTITQVIAVLLIGFFNQFLELGLNNHFFFSLLFSILLLLLLMPFLLLIVKKLLNQLCVYKNNNKFSFEIIERIPGELGRAGIIHTPHGDIKTPAFMSVGTKGEVRFTSMDDLKAIGAQAMLSNGYHLRNTSKEIAKRGGLASWSGWDGPTLTDSGGFQVMSLGSGLGKVVSMEREREVINTDPKDRLTQVTEDGVKFIDPFTNQEDFIGPEESMQIQCRIGADIHMAYDELTSLADSYEYNKEALARTERWAIRSIKEHNKHCDQLGYHQSLYGVIQGGRWEDLRRSTAKKFAKMNFDGYGLGGAFLKENLGDILKWCNEELPENKPRHLLGLSRPDDILIGTEMGADTFDCVAPTREARHGRIYTKYGHINIGKFADSNELLDEHCDCPTCKAGYTRGELRSLMKSKNEDDRIKYFNLASMHNLRFIIRLTEEAREAIINGNFKEYKKEFLNNYYHKNN